MRLFSIQTQISLFWGVFPIKSGEDALFPILARLRLTFTDQPLVKSAYSFKMREIISSFSK